jgi:RNA polymerase sigma-70 factor (ECF subfamily)
MGVEQAVVLPADVRATDPRAHLAALFDAHEDRLYRLARRLTTSIEDANDLVQETFLRAAKSPRRIPRGLASEEAWLVRVLINVRRDQWRQAAVRQRSQHLLHPLDKEGPSDQESALLTKRAVWAALDVLPPRRRAIIVLHELEGLALPDIAALLGITVITVRWHLSIARRDLRRILKQHLEDR